MPEDSILLAHGSGGRRSHDLIRDSIARILGSDQGRGFPDAADLPAPGARLAFTTDSYVVKPMTFPGGDIGTLAVAGTVNDLAVTGAFPAHLSCGLIIEEGLPLAELERVLTSMRDTADAAGVDVVTGDTKVVRRGEADGLFINTSGVGWYPDPRRLSPGPIVPGDAILVSGTMGDHGAAVMAAREGLKTALESDCAPLNGMIDALLTECGGVRFMRDATRGGVATVLNEIAADAEVGIRVDGSLVPVRDGVRGFCEALGLDPLYVANEGKIVVVVDADSSDAALSALRLHPYGSDAALVGRVVSSHPGMVVLDTMVGSGRILDMLSGDQLPRIC